MANRERPRLQQVQCFSTTTSTRVQFLDMMNSFLENNEISLVGPSTIEIQQTEDAGIYISKPFLSLKCEIRSESQSVGSRGARNMLSSNSDLMDSCMSAVQDNQAPLDEGEDIVLKDGQTYIRTADLGDSYPEMAPQMTWEVDAPDFANPLDTVSLGSLSPAISSSVMPVGLEVSLNNHTDSVTSISLSGISYTKSGEHAQLNSELRTSVNGNTVNPLTTWTLSPTSSSATSRNPSISTTGNFLETSIYEQGDFQLPGTERARNTSLGQNGPITVDAPPLTLSAQGSPVSSSHRVLQRQDEFPHLQLRSHHRPQIEKKTPSGSTALVANAASQHILREDYLQFLEVGLPRWGRDTLWGDARYPELPTAATSAYRELELAYSSVCQLDTRMGDDAIRNRMALIRLHLEYTKAYERRGQNGHARTIGRGGASVIIDAILENIHQEWNSFDSKRKSDLRLRFHDRKRYGKRWLLLTDSLGPSILLLCSPKFANMVHNTAVTVKALESITLKVKTDHADTVRILQTMNPIASWLFDNDSATGYKFDDVIEKLRNMRPVAPSSQENN